MEEFHKKLFQILLVWLIPLFMAGLVIALTAPDKRSAPWKYPKDNVKTDGIEGILDIVEIAVDVMLD